MPHWDDSHSCSSCSSSSSSEEEEPIHTTTKTTTTTTTTRAPTTTIPPEIPCLLEGTEVKTIHGYVPIERILVGEKLISDFGKEIKVAKVGKWLKTFEEAPQDLSNIVYKIPKGEYGAQSDVFITHNHRFLDQKQWILRLPYKVGLARAKRSEIVKDNQNNTYTLYHIRMENTDDNFVVNGGCVVESWKT